MKNRYLILNTLLAFACVTTLLTAGGPVSPPTAAAGGGLTASSNLSDLQSTSMARTNLGVPPIASITTPAAMLIQGAAQVASTGANVFTGEQTFNASSTFQGFVGLGGASAPRVKMKTLTGTTPTVAASNTPLLPAGVNSSKVIAASLLVEYSADRWMLGGFNADPGYGVGVVFYGPTDYFVSTGPTAASDVLGKPYKVLVVYEE